MVAPRTGVGSGRLFLFPVTMNEFCTGRDRYIGRNQDKASSAGWERTFDAEGAQKEKCAPDRRALLSRRLDTRIRDSIMG